MVSPKEMKKAIHAVNPKMLFKDFTEHLEEKPTAFQEALRMTIETMLFIDNLARVGKVSVVR